MRYKTTKESYQAGANTTRLIWNASQYYTKKKSEFELEINKAKSSGCNFQRAYILGRKREYRKLHGI